MPGCVCTGLSASVCRGTAGRRRRQPRGASRSPDLRLDFCSRPTAGETDTLGSCLRVGRSLVLRGGAGRLSAVVEGLPRELVRLALEAALPGSCVLGTRGAGRRCATPAPTTSGGAPPRREGSALGVKEAGTAIVGKPTPAQAAHGDGPGAHSERPCVPSLCRVVPGPSPRQRCYRGSKRADSCSSFKSKKSRLKLLVRRQNNWEFLKAFSNVLLPHQI